MDPVWLVVGSVVGTAVLFGGGVWTGWSLLNDRLARVEGDLARATAERDELARRESERARGAAHDLAAAEDLASAASAGDRDGVLRAFPDAADPAAGEPDRVAYAPGGPVHE